MNNLTELKANNKSSMTAKKILGFVGKNYLIVTLIALIIVGSMLSDKFLTARNILNVLLQNSMTTITAMGMLLAIITGGIDLSVGSVIALSGCLVAGFIQGGMNLLAAVLLTIIIMSLLGLCSGVLVSYGKVAPFIVTLAMMTIIRGMAYMYQVGSDRRIDGTFLTDFINSNFAMIPIPVYIMVIVVVVIAFILTKTTFGRGIYAIGGNSETARLAGINVKFTLIAVYVISAILTTISGIIMAGRLSMGTALVGQGFEMDAIASVVVGGAALAGGTGNVRNTVIGAFIIGVLANIMNLMGVAAYPQMIIKGVIIVVAVLIHKE